MAFDELIRHYEDDRLASGAVFDERITSRPPPEVENHRAMPTKSPRGLGFSQHPSTRYPGPANVRW